jgi:hypothetical protein
MISPTLPTAARSHPGLAARRVEVALIGVHVANLGRADDLVLGVTLGDDVALGDVAGAHPFPGERIAEPARGPKNVNIRQIASAFLGCRFVYQHCSLGVIGGAR